MTRFSLLAAAAMLSLTACPDRKAKTPDPEQSRTDQQPRTAPRAEQAPRSTTSGTIDVYLAAGEARGAESCHFSGLSSSAATCEIYRVSYDRSSRQVVDHAKVVGDGINGWMPAISPDGERLAYGRYQGGQGCLAYIKSVDDPAGEAGEAVMCSGMEMPEFWSYPSWLSASALLVSHPETPPQCLSPDGKCMPVERWMSTYKVSLQGDRATTATKLLGAGETARLSIEDTWVNPRDRNLVAGHGRFARSGTKAPTCGGGSGLPCTDVALTPYPFVVDVSTGEYWIFQLRTTEAEYARSGKPLDLAGCAHLAWSPQGDRLLCTEQSTEEMSAQGDNSRLYSFSFDRNRDKAGQINTKDVSPMFSHSEASAVLPLDPGQSCSVFYHKYAEFCGDDEHVVASMVCDCDTEACRKASGTQSQVLQAHVYMLDVSNTNMPVYTDLTQQLEERLGRPVGSMRSFTATCAPGSGDGDAKSGGREQDTRSKSGKASDEALPSGRRSNRDDPSEGKRGKRGKRGNEGRGDRR